jgi:8-oxo-dGTP diphosphatase
MDQEIEKKERLAVSVSAAVFIEDDQGRLLLVQQAAERKGYKWGPPAGGMDPHEDPLKAAKREVREEIGVDVELYDLLGIYTVDRGEKSSGVGFVFRGKIIPDQIKLREGEIKDCKYFSPSEIEVLILQEKLYKPEYNLVGLKDWLDGKSYPLDVIKNLGN